MGDMITGDDIRKLQECLQQQEQIINEIMLMREKIMQVFNKPEKEINDEDINTIKEFNQKVDQLYPWLYSISRENPIEKIKSKIKKIEENKAKYNLVDKEDLVIEENEGDFIKAQELLNQIEANNEKRSKFSKLSTNFHSKLNTKKQEDKKEEIKDDLLEPQENISCVIMNYGGEEKVITTKEMELMKKGLLLTPAYTIAYDYGNHGDERGYKVKHYDFDDLSFTTYEEATLDGKQAIREKEEKILEIRDNKNHEYDRKGKISIPISMRTDDHGKIVPDLSTSLETTQRELARAGIDPEDYVFERRNRKSLINSTTITQLDQDLALTTREVGGIKGIVRRLLDKLKGKGEK